MGTAGSSRGQPRGKAAEAGTRPRDRRDRERPPCPAPDTELKGLRADLRPRRDPRATLDLTRTSITVTTTRGSHNASHASRGRNGCPFRGIEMELGGLEPPTPGCDTRKSPEPGGLLDGAASAGAIGRGAEFRVCERLRR